MIEVVNLTPAATAGGHPPAAAPTGADGSGAEASFSELLGAGIEKLAQDDAKIADAARPGSPANDDRDPSGVGPDALLNQVRPADASIAPQCAPLPAMGPPFAPPPQVPALAVREGEPTISRTTNGASRALPLAAAGAQADPARAARSADTADDRGRLAHSADAPAPELSRTPLPAFASAATAATERNAQRLLEHSTPATTAPDSPMQGLLSSHRPAETAAARIEQIPQQVGTPAWDDALSGRVVWMAKNDVQSAEIRLNPQDLGPIEVRLSLSGDQNNTASVQFTAVHGTTRDAIEAALPRLREMLEASGISLGNASVDAGGAGHAGNPGEFARPGAGASGLPGAESRPESTGEMRLSRPGRRGNGLVDTFA